MRRAGKKRGLAISESSSEGSNATDEDEDDTPFAGARPDVSSDAEHDENEDTTQDQDENWIVDDEGPSSAVLPTEFSMDTHQDLMHHFKIICQLFVHLAVLPAGERASFIKHHSEGTYFYRDCHEALPPYSYFTLRPKRERLFQSTSNDSPS